MGWWGVAHHGSQDGGQIFGDVVDDRINAGYYGSQGDPLVMNVGQSTEAVQGVASPGYS